MFSSQMLHMDLRLMTCLVQVSSQSKLSVFLYLKLNNPVYISK